MTTSDCHRLESDVVDSKVEKRLHHHPQGVLPHDHEYQICHGSMHNSVFKICEALTPAWERASCESCTYA
eukprot:3488657-Pyramimonas_sp.AAC.1